MAEDDSGAGRRVGAGADRREIVLTAALDTFLRYGYRKTSMDDVAAAAHISRPGLYFLFTSKQDLFTATITRALDQDLRTAARALDDEARPLHERLLDAFDTWTGRYLGAAGGELSDAAEAHRDLLGTTAADASHRFRLLITDAVVSGRPPRDRATSEAIARTLISTAVGLKHQTTSRMIFRQELGTAIALLLRGPSGRTRQRSGPPSVR